MSNSGQAFFLKSRFSADLATTFAEVDVSALGGVTLVRRAAANTLVSNVESITPLRRTDAGVFVSHVESLTVLRLGQLVQLFDRSSTAAGARTARASWGTNTPTGDVLKTNSSGLYAIDYTWMLAGVTSDYEIRATVISGSNPTAGDALNTWLPLSTARKWDYQVSGKAKYIDGTILFEIRDTATSTVQDSCNVFFTAYTDGGVFL
jgi:hypothetical protein